MNVRERLNTVLQAIYQVYDSCPNLYDLIETNNKIKHTATPEQLFEYYVIKTNTNNEKMKIVRSILNAKDYQ